MGSRSETQALFRRLKSVVQLYRLNVGPTLGSKMASETANTATELQLWQVTEGCLSQRVDRA